MRNHWMPACLSLLALSLATPAAAVDLSIDLFGTPAGMMRSEDRASGTVTRTDQPRGVGAAVTLWPGSGALFYSAEYARLKPRNRNGDGGSSGIGGSDTLDQARLGVGLINRTAFYSRFEVVRTAFGEDHPDRGRDFSLGLAAHAGVAGALYQPLLASAEIGWADLDLFNERDERLFGRGLQATVRAELAVVSVLQLFTEYRYQNLRLKGVAPDAETAAPSRLNELGEWRVGVRMNF